MPSGLSENNRNSTATSVAEAPARTRHQFFAPWAESLAYAQQAPTTLRREVGPVHVVHDLCHARSELHLGLADPGASKLRVQEAADVADGRLVRIHVAKPRGQPSSGHVGLPHPTLHASTVQSVGEEAVQLAAGEDSIP